MHKKIRIIILLFATILLLAACQADEPAQPEMVAIQLPMGYIADPQFAPFYVAQERGYFAEAGFDVTFEYIFETEGVSLVGATERPFAIVSGDQVLLARAQSVPVVYVMEWFQKFPIVVVSKVEAGIETPADLNGRTVGLPGFFGASYVGYLGLLSASGLQPDEVKANDIGFNQVESLLTDQSEAVVGYANNEPVQLAAQGVPVNIIQVSDTIDLVANGIITNETVMAENPELVERFVGAVLRGLADTLADPDAAFAISQKYVDGLEDGRKPVLEASLPLWQADTLGLTDLASWENTQQVLLGAGLLDEPVGDLTAVFTNEFVLANQE
ncbi:MAG: ABC transporter substrate-binding protein [Ardenticatenaceae bacterium]|nr:ABC transporter substrate-binding protein [Anaerolineales bacterium]MCB8941355.1 ABC transporter substrate-binding protein [Ardenticatenaceae bacterium]MCB8972711.1 ABC transporter substrate-binding protein [Ardenticatenaceae bacterium]